MSNLFVGTVNKSLVLDIPGELIPSPNGSHWVRVVVHPDDAYILFDNLRGHVEPPYWASHD